MQKAFFNDKYQQTDAVIEGRKTMARQIMAGIDFPVNMVMGRALPDKDGKIYAVANGENIIVKLRYKVGEVVAVAQCYYNAFSSRCDIPVYGADRTPGWLNKMFVRADLMPHQIRITGIKCERLQDISDADCLKEGIFVNEYFGNGKKCHHYGFDGFFNGTEGWFARGWFDTPREAFAELIDKVSGKGTWKSNPWVVAYEFELVK